MSMVSRDASANPFFLAPVEIEVRAREIRRAIIQMYTIIRGRDEVCTLIKLFNNQSVTVKGSLESTTTLLNS